MFSIEAINEPIQDASKTPGLGRYEKSFVLGLRAIEYAMGIICDNSVTAGIFTDSIAKQAFVDAIPIIKKLSYKYHLDLPFGFETSLSGIGKTPGNVKHGILNVPLKGCGRKCLTTQFMSRDWQYNNPANPSDAAHGPQVCTRLLKN